MLRLIVCAVLCIQIASAFVAVDFEKRRVEDKGDYLEICKHEPIDLGIVVDSSSSIDKKDFQKGLEFLQNFLKGFSIGDGRNDVRVSVTTFGRGVYKKNGFNLDQYHNYGEVREAISKIEHKAGPYTATNKGIEYMHNDQMSMARPYAEKVAIVFTDGNSQQWRNTERASIAARKSGIKMFCVGIGRAVREAELLRIAGDPSRVIKVKSYDDLGSIKNKLVNETCIRKIKPTTTPPPKAECGEEFPADINFVFSPADLGHDGTQWATNFISLVVENEKMTQGFRYGAITGSCPDDEGFDLDEYDNKDEIKRRLTSYENYTLPSLIRRTVEQGFEVSAGGREEAQDVAVIVIGDQPSAYIQEQIYRLAEQGVRVAIADPYGINYQFNGAFTLPGPSSRESANTFVDLLCGEH